MQDMATGNRVHKAEDRRGKLYQTPPIATEALHKCERLDEVIWEPACGPGAIVEVLRSHHHAVIASDLNDYGCPDSVSNIDFLLERRPPGGCKTIVTNPPFELAEEFVAHAIDICPRVYMLLRLAFLEGQRWEIKRDFGNHLARVRIFTPRLPFMHREDFADKKDVSSGMAFAWFVFVRDFHRHGVPTISWIRWKDFEKC